MGVFHLAERNCAHLSGGEQQLVLEQVKGLAGGCYTVLLSTHNPQHTLSFADSILAALGKADSVLTPELIQTLYRIDAACLETKQGRVIQPIMK